MSYIWFNLVLEALGKRLNYESISNLYGNSFAKDSSKIIQGANPLTKMHVQKGVGIMGLASKIKIIDAKNDVSKAQIKSQLGNIDWADGAL